ncbi:IclR-type transcriptional regulator [Bombiscardovia coagulans]|uniref:IclR-type transcriptional regulator n=2 Tax=Bombiscardovia coagulans TaxID=686666 RepID=A0A261EV03_9BIFI|nr:IclR-type transcriptional regulator [Bombiscardovia coagulans]
MAHSSHTTVADHTCFQDAMTHESSVSTNQTTTRDNWVHTNVGVLDKIVEILEALEAGPISLGHLVTTTGLARPTVHRLAMALERHQFIYRDDQGRFALGSRFAEFAASASEDLLLGAANPILRSLHNRTGESVHIFRRQGDNRVCIAAATRSSGVYIPTPLGALLPMHAGSAAQILLAWDAPERIHQTLRKARFTATILADVRRRGWAESISEYQQGICSISAPIRSATGQVMAAISIAGPVERMSSTPGRLYAPLVMAAGKYLSEAMHAPVH